MSWGVKRQGDGFVPTWNGETWWVRHGHEPRNEEWVKEYVANLAERYPKGGAWLIEQAKKQGRRRVGDGYRYTYPGDDGDVTDTIQAHSLESAKKILRRELDRERLPNGITWEIL